MLCRIKNLETVQREYEMENYRLQKRIRVFDEHKANTDRSRRESSLMLEEMYCTVMQRFEKLQEENNRNKCQIRELAAEVACNSDAHAKAPPTPAACPKTVENYEQIVRDYEVASENFMRILANKERDEQERRRNAAKNVPSKLPIVPANDSNQSCPSQNTKMLLAAINNNCNKSNKCMSNVDAASNTSTRGSTMPPPPPSKAIINFYDDIYGDNCKASEQSICEKMAEDQCGRKRCTFWPDEECKQQQQQVEDDKCKSCTFWPEGKQEEEGEKNKKREKEKKKKMKSVVKLLGRCAVKDLDQGGLDGCNVEEEADEDEDDCEGKRPQDNVPFVAKEINNKKDGECPEEEGEGDDDDDDEEVKGDDNWNKFKCHACNMSGSTAVVAKTCNCKWKPNYVARSKTVLKVPESPKKLLQRQAEAEDSDDDLLEDMIKADEAQRLQRSAAPEPSARRLKGVVSFAKSPNRSVSPAAAPDRDRSMSAAPEARRSSLPRILGDKIETMKRMVGDFVKTLFSPSRAFLGVPSTPEVKLRGSPATPRKSPSKARESQARR